MKKDQILNKMGYVTQQNTSNTKDEFIQIWGWLPENILGYTYIPNHFKNNQFGLKGILNFIINQGSHQFFLDGWLAGSRG